MKMHLICCAVALAAAACTHSSVMPGAVAQVDDGEHHVAIRAEAGRLWWAHREWTEPHPLCALPAEGRVDNLTVAREADGFVVTFDQGGTSWRGKLDEGKHDRVTSLVGGFAPPTPEKSLAPLRFASLARSDR